MKRTLFLFLALLSVVGALAAETPEPTYQWEIDKKAMVGEGAKLASIALVPVALFIAGAVIVPSDYKDFCYISGAVFSVPALIGITLFTIDLISYNPNEALNERYLGVLLRKEF